MKSYHYQCEKCATLIQAASSPGTQGCPKGFPHKWVKLGPVGSKNYQCRKCGTVVATDSTPSTLGCPQGFPHQWSKL